MPFFARQFHRDRDSFRRRPRSLQGSSLVEVLVSAILLVIVATGTIGAIQISAQTSGLGRVNQFTNSRIASDIEQARAIASGLCRAANGSYSLNNPCASSLPLRQMCNASSNPSFAQAIAQQLPTFDENGWPNNRGVLQGSRVDQGIDTSRQTVLVLSYRDRDSNRLITQADIIPPAVGYCPCSADSLINPSTTGVAICR